MARAHSNCTREKRGLSSDKLARWEKGQAKFNPEEIARLGKALDAATIARAERVEGPLAGSGGKGVRSLRRAYGITQEELARRAEMTQASISLFENGYVALDAEEENEIRAACEELVRERTPAHQCNYAPWLPWPAHSLSKDRKAQKSDCKRKLHFSRKYWAPAKRWKRFQKKSAQIRTR